MTRIFALSVLLAMGCNGDKDGDSGGTGETGAPDTGNDTGTPGGTDCATGNPAPAGVVAITSASVDCKGTTVTISANTDGLTAGGEYWGMDSANNPPAEEDHPLDSTGADAACNRDVIGATIEVGGAFEPGVTTIHTCDGHHNSPGPVMTYAIGAYDPNGTIADCVAWGVDVQDFIAGTLGAPPFDATACREITPMR